MIFNVDHRTLSAEELEEPQTLANLAARKAQLLKTWAHRDQTLDESFPSIRDFYRGQHLFVTGGTGFCGKVIVEKLLHACPDIGNVYLLIRPGRGGQTPADRLQDMIRLPMFDRLRNENPAVLKKMVVVEGDCMQEGLGLSADDRRTLTERVSVVIHGAASVRFNDPVKKAVRMNLRSTMDVVELAREMKGLKVLVHISTAYCNTAHNPTLERTYPTEHDYKDVLQYTQLPDSHALDILGPKFLGYQPNSYVFTKALSEQVIRDAAKDLPIIVVRPSIVTCALKEPEPGWMDNLNGLAMFWAVVFKGVQRVHYTPIRNMYFDVIAVDHVAKVTILASWARGTGQPIPCQPGDVQVANLTAADIKPTSMRMMMHVLPKHTYDKVIAYPNVVRYPHLLVTDCFPLFYVLMLLYHVLFGAFVDTLLVAFKQKPQLLPAYRKIEGARQALSYFAEKEFLFESDNMWRLQSLAHPRDRDSFDLMEDASRNWYDISKDQVWGVLKYALKERVGGPEEQARNARIISVLWWVEACWYVFLAAVALWFVACRFMT